MTHGPCGGVRGLSVRKLQPQMTLRDLVDRCPALNRISQQYRISTNFAYK